MGWESLSAAVANVLFGGQTMDEHKIGQLQLW